MLTLLVTLPLFADATSIAKARSKAFEAAFAAHDAKAMLAMYADDARIVWPGQGEEATGRAAIAKRIDAFLKMLPASTLTMKSVDAMALGTRYIATVGRWEQTATMPEGRRRRSRSGRVKFFARMDRPGSTSSTTHRSV